MPGSGLVRGVRPLSKSARGRTGSSAMHTGARERVAPGLANVDGRSQPRPEVRPPQPVGPVAGLLAPAFDEPARRGR